MKKGKPHLIAFPKDGVNTHLVVDTEVTTTVTVLTACGKLIHPSQLTEVMIQQITCTRCRSVAKQYGYQL